MNAIVRMALVALLISITLPAYARKKPKAARTSNKAQIEAAARLQVFLDHANFSPGKIDGRYNDLTLKALGLYRESRGEQAPIPPAQPKGKTNAPPDLN